MIATTTRLGRSPMGGLLLAPVLALAAADAAVAIMNGNSLAHLVLVLVGVMAVAAALRWRWGIYLVLIDVTIEGAVTNLLYPSPYPVLFKDGLILCVYLGFLRTVLRDGAHGAFPRAVVRPLIVFTAICLVESFNPAGGGGAVALVGLRVLLFYIPLFFVGAWLGMRDGTLERVVHWVLVLSLPITGFGIYEHFAGPDAIAGLGEGFAKGVFVIGPEATKDAIFRPTSTFAFTGHFGDFLFVIALLCIGALSAPQTVRRRLVLALVLSVTLVGVVLNAQRTTWVLLPIATVMLFVMNRRASGAIRTIPLLAIGLVVAVSFGGAVLADRLPLLTDNSTQYSSRFANLEQPFITTLQSPTALTGNGTGTALGAERHVNGGLVPQTFESGWAIPLSMLGIWGVIALGWLYIAVFRLMWRSMRSLDHDARWVPTAIFVFCLLAAVVGGSINYPPKNVYFWLFAGLVSARALRDSPVLPDGAGDRSPRTRPGARTRALGAGVVTR